MADRRPPPKRKHAPKKIVFNEAWRTFSIYPGNSLYAFCITPEGSLEHLYWGKELEKGYDLRYLSQSSRLIPYDTVEEILQIKKHSRLNLFEDQKAAEGDLDPRNKLRYDNLKWRVQALNSKKKTSSDSLPDFEGLDMDTPITRPGNSPREVSTVIGTVSLMPNKVLSSGNLNITPAPSLVPPSGLQPNRGGGGGVRARSASTPLRMNGPLTNMSETDDNGPNGKLIRNNNTHFDFAPRRIPVDQDGRVKRSGSVSITTNSSNDKLSDGDDVEMKHQVSHSEVADFSFGSLDSKGEEDSSMAEAGEWAMGRNYASVGSLRSVGSEGYMTDHSDGEYSTRHKNKFSRKQGLLGKSTLCMEYSDLGTGDFRSPSFQVGSSNGSTITPVRYVSHQIIAGKPELPDYLPGIKGTYLLNPFPYPSPYTHARRS